MNEQVTAGSPQPSIYWIGMQGNETSEPDELQPQPAPANVPPLMINFNGWPITLRADLNEIRQAISSAYAIGTSDKVRELGYALEQALGSSFGKLRWRPERRTSTMFPRLPSAAWQMEGPRRLLDPAENVFDLYINLFNSACARLWGEQIRQLKDVEETAIRIIQRRLEVSRAQVRAEANRYLTGFDSDALFADPKKELKFPSSTQLSPLPNTQKLREDLTPINNLKQELEILEFASRIKEVKERPDASLNNKIQVLKERYARLVHDLGKHSPILHWIGGTDPENNAELRKTIMRELEKTWNSALAVEQRLKERPAAALEYGTEWPTEQLGSRIKGVETQFQAVEIPYSRPVDSMGFMLQINQVDKRGPWAYPRIIAEAIEELGWSPPSLETTAVEEVFSHAAASGMRAALGESFFLMAVGAALHAIPPVGLAADILIGTYETVVALDEYERESEDFRAMLDPADALALPPGFLPVFAAIVGALPFIPGKAQLFVGVLPAILPQGGK